MLLIRDAYVSFFSRPGFAFFQRRMIAFGNHMVESTIPPIKDSINIAFDTSRCSGITVPL